MATSGIRGDSVGWSGLWTGVEAQAIERLDQFNEQGLVNVVWAFATASHAAAPTFTSAASCRVADRISTLTPQGLANSAWAFATSHAAASSQGRVPAGERAAPEFYAALEEEVPLRGIDIFKDQELCNIVWALATSGTEAPRLLDLAAGYVDAHLESFSTQGIANTLWSYATLGYDAPAVFERIAAHSIGRLHEFNQQELSLTAWSYATMGVPAPKLFDALAREAARRKHELNPQAVSNMAWAYASSSHSAPELFEALADQLERNYASFHPQGLAITSWAFASAGYLPSRELQGIMHNQSLKLINEFNEQGLANVAWAAANMGTVPAPALYDAIADRCIGILGTFNHQGLANLLWSFAKKMHPSDAFFDAAIPYVLASGDQKTTSQSLVSMLWSYAVLGYTPPELFRPIAATVRERLPELSPQGLANVAWAYAVADVDGPEIDALFGDGAFVDRCAVVIGEAKAYSSEGSSAHEHLRQLHQWQLWRDWKARRSGATTDAWPPLPEKMREQCATAFSDDNGRPSEFQRLVFGVVADLGLEPAEEVITSLGYSLDMVARLPATDECAVDDENAPPPGCSLTADAGVFPGDAASDLVAIEVDGPTHFLYHTKRPSGPTILKRRQLERSGWRLVSVPFFEWQEAARGARGREEREARRRRYMERKLGMG